jgi:hypothetical protein
MMMANPISKKALQIISNLKSILSEKELTVFNKLMRNNTKSE